MSAAPSDEKTPAGRLRLRGAPTPVARLSRRALVVLGVGLGLGLAAALGWSLVERHAAAPEQALTPSPPPPEEVTRQPRDYVGKAGAPILGPPLPGDLGRPMVAAAMAGRTVTAPQLGDGLAPGPTGPGASVPPTLAPVTTDPRDKAASLREAALTSGVFAAGISRTVTAPPPSAEAVAGDREPEIDTRATSPERLREPASPYILQAGVIIPAALVTGLRSDTPGLAIAQVSQDVFDSLGGGHLLIPVGARLIGSYDTSVRDGQTRLSVAWTRLILPSGRSIILDNLPGADTQGMAGLRDGVDRHGGRILGAAALSTVLAIGAEAGVDGDSDVVRAIRRGASQAVSDVGSQAVGRSLALAPTLTIRPGAPLRVLLTKDLVLEPYRERSAP